MVPDEFNQGGGPFLRILIWLFTHDVPLPIPGHISGHQ